MTTNILNQILLIAAFLLGITNLILFLIKQKNQKNQNEKFLKNEQTLNKNEEVLSQELQEQRKIQSRMTEQLSSIEQKIILSQTQISIIKDPSAQKQQEIIKLQTTIKSYLEIIKELRRELQVSKEKLQKLQSIMQANLMSNQNNLQK